MFTLPHNSMYCFVICKMSFISSIYTRTIDMMSFLHRLRPDFLSLQKLLAAILLHKKSIMQVLAANILMRISVVKIVCERFVPWQESRPKTPAKRTLFGKHFPLLVKHTCAFGHQGKHCLVSTFYLSISKIFLLVTKKCLSSTWLCSGQTDKHCTWQAKFEMFASAPWLHPKM